VALRERTRRAAARGAVFAGGGASDGEEDHPRCHYLRIHDDDAYAAVGTRNAAGMKAYVEAVTSRRAGTTILRASLETQAMSRLTIPIVSQATEQLGSDLTPEDVRRIVASVDASGMVEQACRARKE
jgi:hypothetical protein